MRHTTALTTATLLFTLTACTSTNTEPAKPDTPATTPKATAAPSLNPAETERQCSTAIAEAAPTWDDWGFDLGNWEDDPRTPDVCKGLADKEFPPRGNRAFQDALIDGLEAADDPRASQ